MHLPVPPQGSREAQRQLGARPVHRPLPRPGEYGAQVVTLALQPVEPLTLVGSGQLALCSLAEGEEALVVPSLNLLSPPALFQPLTAVLSHRLKHRVPNLAIRSHPPGDQGPVLQPEHEVGDNARLQFVVRAHNRGCLGGPATGEYRQVIDQTPLLRAQQIVAPVQCQPQRTVVGSRG